MAKAKRPDPHKAIADAVKAKKDSDGMVKVYPTEPVGEARVPNVAAVPQTVTAASAQEMLEAYPPAFSLYESGNVMTEQRELEAVQSEQAWGVSDPEDAPDVVSDMSPPFTAVPEPEKE